MQLRDTTLLQFAQEARERAYAPYSGFRVGAALLTASGKVFTGCNVENATYGATLCAERAAISSAIVSGERSFTAIAIVGNGQEPCMPCGICRQVLCEFSPQMRVICWDGQGGTQSWTAGELLPGHFTLSKNV
ncbi:MAG: cytidine deaminase [Eubacteriales bacterium]|jgi:cytidine deaminase